MLFDRLSKLIDLHSNKVEISSFSDNNQVKCGDCYIMLVVPEMKMTLFLNHC